MELQSIVPRTLLERYFFFFFFSFFPVISCPLLQTALHLAAGGGHVDVLKLLIEKGANVEAKDAGGETPLHVAVSNGKAKCVAELLKNGADAWAHKNSQGKSAYAQAQDLAKVGEEGKLLLRAFSEVYDMGGAETQDPSQPPRWVPDDSVTECSACGDAFNLVRRKHHCRACGKIFCSKCSSGAVPLLKFDILKNVRVCDACFASVMAEMGAASQDVKTVTARSPRGVSPPSRPKERRRSKSKGPREPELSIGDVE